MTNKFWAAVLCATCVTFGGAVVWGQSKTGGKCEEGFIPRCVIEYYNDGSRVEIYTDVEGGGRVE